MESTLCRPLQSITGSEGGITVLRKVKLFSLCKCHYNLNIQFRDYLYIAYNGDGEESENVLIRKIHVFQRIVGYLFGPVSSRYALSLMTMQKGSMSLLPSIKPSNLEERKKVWAKLSSLLTTYSKLYLEDQVFLLEVKNCIGPIC